MVEDSLRVMRSLNLIFCNIIFLWMLSIGTSIYADVTSVPILDVTAGDLHQPYTIAFEGLTQTMQTDILETLYLKHYEEYARKSPDNFRLLFYKSMSEIKQDLIPYGYYNVSIEGRLLREKGKGLTILYHVNLADPVRIQRIDFSVEGVNVLDSEKERFKKRVFLEKGEVLTEEKYERLKLMLLNKAYSHGYFDAFLEKHKIYLNAKKTLAVLILKLNLETRYLIGKVAIKVSRQNFREDFLKKYLDLFHNHYYSDNAIRETKNNYQSSNFFSNILVISDVSRRDKVTHHVDMQVDLTQKVKRNYLLGGGYGTFTGVRLKTGAIFRNLSDQGNYASINAEWSWIATTFSANYFIPGEDPVHNFWRLTAQQSLYALNAYNATVTQFGPAYVYQKKHFILTMSMNTYIALYSDATASKRWTSNFVANFQFNYINYQKYGYWDRGFRFINNLQYSPDILSTKTDFVRDFMSVYLSVPLNHNWTRLFVSLNYGGLFTNNVYGLAPIFRFYAGGVGNLLGYNYASNGPMIKGRVVGGKYLATGMTGLEERIYGKFSTMVYYDAGNAANDWDLSDVPVLRGAGVGLSYKTPLGPITIYITRAIDDHDWNFEASISMNLS